MTMPLRDYLAWHDDYERPGSALHLRLLVVQDLIARALDGLPAGPVRMVSICAGQGRDVLGVVERHRRGDDVRGRLVELEPANVERARDRLQARGNERIEVVCADAGSSDAYTGAVPADLVLVCGVFGNIVDSDIERTVRALPQLCAPGAAVVWTRHPRVPGVIPAIEGWLGECGFEPNSLVIGEGDLFGAGLHRFTGTSAPLAPSERWFDFVR
jgi:hypothetical protein